MTPPPRFPIVGIGASAGGVAALQALFRAMPPPGPAAAFVVVTHLGHGHVSALPSIIAECTAMPVLPAKDGDALQSGTVHVLVTDAIITVASGRLRVQPQYPAARRERQPIDVFLASLANEHADWAVGVVLSGSGNDGTLGLKAVKERGGLTLAQGSDGHPPAYPDMPASAVASGSVDLLVPVDDMPALLVEFTRGLAALEKVVEDTSPADKAQKRNDLKRVICGVLHDRTGHDFTEYKNGTFFRRVQRRIQVLRLAGGMDAYVAHLVANDDEAGLLFRDLLIGVTGFFRDPEAFSALEQRVIPALLEGRGADDTLRVWVPGCSTGEEAYSLAILLREALDAHPNGPRAQVFATDIDEAALGVARSGRYPAQMLATVSSERLARHFVFDGTTYAAAKPLRELCVFSTHSLVRDAPFSRIDLVSCRNLLIYLGGRLQDQVLPLVHYALRPGGYLFLGISETIAQHAELFTPEDKTYRIFRRRERDSAGMPAVPMRVERVTRGILARNWPAQIAGPRRSFGASSVELRQATEAFILEGFAPAHLVVDRQGEVVYQSARLGKYLEPATGRPSSQLFAIARLALRLELRAALRQAVETGKRAFRPRVEVQVEDRRQAVAVTVTPLPMRDPDADPFFAVVFTDLGPPMAAEALPEAETASGGVDGSLVAQLEREVREMREAMQSAAEEYETATEELRAANEELVSVNEELQSTNEELETSKEELQSVNEEFRTVNVELSGKIEELDRANADLRNLFESTEVATVFLDRHLVIRSFTPAITSIFNLQPGDVGRPLTDFALRLSSVDIRAETRLVLNGREGRERRVTSADGTTHFLMRLLPYRAVDGTIDGVVVTFVDVTKVVEGELLGTMVDELNHRVRNVLQVVQAVATHTIRRSASLKDFEQVFRGRIGALARAHELVSDGKWADVSLRDLVTKEMAPYAPGADQVVLDGRPLRLKPKAALALGMVLHELATNAAKYGALSVPTGHVTVRWEEPKGARQLILRWTEEGGPPVTGIPERRGFGSELIERQLRHDLGGSIDTAFEVAGLRATLSLPLEVVRNPTSRVAE